MFPVPTSPNLWFYTTWKMEKYVNLTHMRCKQLLKTTQSTVDPICSSDEVFAVEPQFNSQNDRLYISLGAKNSNITANRLLHTRSRFTKSLIVSVAVSKTVSKMDVTTLFFVDPSVK